MRKMTELLLIASTLAAALYVYFAFGVWGRVTVSLGKLSITDIDLWVLGILGVVYFFCLFHRFIRFQCRRCGSGDIRETGVELLDRWIGTKKVREHVGDKVRDRTVNVTKQLHRHAFACDGCGYQWQEKRTTELN